MAKGMKQTSSSKGAGVVSKGFGDSKGTGYMGMKTVKGGASGGKKSGK